MVERAKQPYAAKVCESSQQWSNWNGKWGMVNERWGLCKLPVDYWSIHVGFEVSNILFLGLSVAIYFSFLCKTLQNPNNKNPNKHKIQIIPSELFSAYRVFNKFCHLLFWDAIWNKIMSVSHQKNYRLLVHISLFFNVKYCLCLAC